MEKLDVSKNSMYVWYLIYQKMNVVSKEASSVYYKQYFVQ